MLSDKIFHKYSSTVMALAHQMASWTLVVIDPYNGLCWLIGNSSVGKMLLKMLSGNYRLFCSALIPSARMLSHDDVIKWKHFPRYWPFVRGIHRSAVNSPHKGQGRRALMFSLIYARITGWVNNREAGDLRRHRAHDIIVMSLCCFRWDFGHSRRI